MKEKAKFAPSFLIALAILAILFPSYTRLFESFELATLDFRFRIRPVQIQNADVAIIEIANDTLEKIGRWPFKRSWHAAMIDILSAYGAKMIIFDTLFTEPSEDDLSLIESTKKAGNVYYGFSFDITPRPGRGKIIEAEKIDSYLLSDLREYSHGYGFINVTPDRDGKTRKAPLKISFEDKIYPHLALLTASDYLDKDFNKLKIPKYESSYVLINFAGRWKETFKHYSYVDVLKSYSLLTKGEKGPIDLNGFKDKVCFIGLTATGTHDLNPIPLEERYPGLGVHVSLFNTIATQNFLYRLPRIANTSILSILILIILFLSLRPRPFISWLSVTSMIAVLVILGLFLFIYLGIWIDIFYPIIALFIVYLSLTFYKYVSERQKRRLIERELEVARKIQFSFLPERPPDIKDVDISAEMFPAKQVGGDLYDFVELGDGRVGIMIGDVSGKGVPAALYMAKVVSEFRFFSKTGLNTKDALTRLNDELSRESKTNLFVTLTYLIYDPKGHLLTFSSGGHLATMWLRKDETECRLLEAKEGLPLGLMPAEFSEESLPSISEGDILVLYTDGVTEAMNRHGEEFGQDRLLEVVQKNRSLDSKNLLFAIKDTVFKFSKATLQHDDITIIVMEVQ